MNKKTASITVRLTPEQKQSVEEAAANLGLTVTDFIKASISEKLNDKSLYKLNMSDAISEAIKIETTITKEQELKIIKMAEELGATKQECIRRLINEGNIYDLRIDINMEEEFLSLTAKISELNRMISGVYTVCRRVDGVFTKHEVDHLFSVMTEIRENTNGIISAVYSLCNRLTVMARKRMEKLIKEKTKEGGD